MTIKSTPAPWKPENILGGYYMGLVERWYQFGARGIEEKIARNHQIKENAFKVKLERQI